MTPKDKKFCLLKYESCNLGDDIQTVAVMDIMDDLGLQYSFVYRDLINGYFFNPLYDNYVIFNGWFSNGYGFEEYYTHPGLRDSIEITWPPKGNFKPIFYSFHISDWAPPGNRVVHPAFTSEQSINFYKSGADVGCRDEHTLNIMRQHDVNAYLSKCVTLTFDKKKYVLKDSGKYSVFVDVPNDMQDHLEEKLKTIYPYDVRKYTHYINDPMLGAGERFSLARKQLSIYCNAQLVVTTRLHVLLPCLAFGVPVLFIVNDNDLDNSRIKDYLQFTDYLLYSEVYNCELKNITFKYDSGISLKTRDNIINKIRQK